MYPEYMREAGYYCTNNRKEDYNLEKPGRVWDASGRNAPAGVVREAGSIFSRLNSSSFHSSADSGRFRRVQS